MGKNISGSGDLTNPSRLHRNLPPAWEVLSLVARYLDPNTLATASCVSKQWSICFSSDHLWEPLCTARYFSLLFLQHHHSSTASLPYHRIYSLGHAADRRCSWRQYSKPSLSLDNLLFAIGLYRTGSGKEFHQSVVVTSQELQLDPHGMFSFEMNLGTPRHGHHVHGWALDLVGPLRMMWSVGLDGWKGVFTLMDEEDNGSLPGRLPAAAGPGGWISKELPGPGCCPSGKGSGLVANIRLQIKNDQVEEGGDGGHRRVAVEKVRVGLVNMITWSDLSLEDGLLYLQHFLC